MQVKIYLKFKFWVNIISDISKIDLTAAANPNIKVFLLDLKINLFSNFKLKK